MNGLIDLFESFKNYGDRQANLFGWLWKGAAQFFLECSHYRSLQVSEQQ